MYPDQTPYTQNMRTHHSIHLLIAVSILFSQIVAGFHMAGHVHGPAVNTTSAPAESFLIASLQTLHPAHLTTDGHEALHQQVYNISASPDSVQGQSYLDLSCFIYHVYAGSLCVSANPAAIPGGMALASRQQVLHSSAPLAPRPEHLSIRGPPVFS